MSVETAAVGRMSAATADAVASSFGLGVPARDPVYAARGELGRIWRLDTGGGSWAVKELLLPVSEADASRDVEFQLAAESAGIPLPPPCRTRDGRVVLPAEETASPWSLRVYRWVDLVNWPAVSGADIGSVTAHLHLVRHHNPGPVEAWFCEPVGEPAWEAMLSQASRGNARWAMPLGRWLPDLIALDAVVVPPDPAQLTTCHRDLNTENVRRAADGGVIVLDWENSGPDQPERELATVVSDLAADAGLNVAAAAYTAYQVAGGPARLTGAADFSTAVAVQGHLLQFYSRRALNPAESRQNRARAEVRLDQMLSQPLTIARINHLTELLVR